MRSLIASRGQSSGLRPRLRGYHQFLGKSITLRSATPPVHVPFCHSSVSEVDDLLWTSHVSKRINLSIAIEDAVSTAQSKFQTGQQPDVAIVFVSSAYADQYERVVPLLREHLPSLKYVFGTSGFGVIGSSPEGPQEIEHAPAITVTLAKLPQTDVSVRHVTNENLPDGDAPPAQWSNLVGVPLGTAHLKYTNFVIVADITFTRLNELLGGLDFAFPEAEKIGGLASSGVMGDARAMWGWSSQQEGAEEGSGMFRTGAVVLALHGAVAFELVIAQGCRPLCGRVWSMQRLEGGNQLVAAVRDPRQGADAQVVPPLTALKADFAAMKISGSELSSVARNLALGLSPDDFEDIVRPEDLLIRGVGFDPSTGHMAIGDRPRVGARFMFMVRDREGAMQDLGRHCLALKRRSLEATLSLAPGAAPPSPFGMLVFSCNGRGTALYGEQHYDSRQLGQYVSAPCAGFMGNGEIGTVNSITHLHGFTCAVALLRSMPVSAVLPESTFSFGEAGGAASSGGGEGAMPPAAPGAQGAGVGDADPRPDEDAAGS